MLTPAGIILLICILLKAFGIIEVSWWIALISLWFAVVIAIAEVILKK